VTKYLTHKREKRKQSITLLRVCVVSNGTI